MAYHKIDAIGYDWMLIDFSRQFSHFPGYFPGLNTSDSSGMQSTVGLHVDNELMGGRAMMLTERTIVKFMAARVSEKDVSPKNNISHNIECCGITPVTSARPD